MQRILIQFVIHFRPNCNLSSFDRNWESWLLDSCHENIMRLVLAPHRRRAKNDKLPDKLTQEALSHDRWEPVLVPSPFLLHERESRESSRRWRSWFRDRQQSKSETECPRWFRSTRLRLQYELDQLWWCDLTGARLPSKRTKDAWNYGPWRYEPRWRLRLYEALVRRRI